MVKLGNPHSPHIIVNVLFLTVNDLPAFSLEIIGKIEPLCPTTKKSFLGK